MLFAQVVLPAEMVRDTGAEMQSADEPVAAPPAAGKDAPPGSSPPEPVGPAAPVPTNPGPADGPPPPRAAESTEPRTTPRNDAPPTSPATPTPARDETTGQVVPLRDETGQTIIQRDETGQPIVERDETGQELPDPDVSDESSPQAAFDSLLRPAGVPSGLGVDEDGVIIKPGGSDWMTNVALVEGYNTNVQQTQDIIGGPAFKHPSPFTGLDAVLEYRTWTSPYDTQEFRLQLRGQHYTPLDGYPQPDDGSVNAGYNGQITLAPRTVLTARVIGTVSTVNSSRLDDGALFQVDPTGEQRTYALVDARTAVVHELAPRLRLVVGADAQVSYTIYDAPIQYPDGSSQRRHGVDYVQPGVDVALYHDIDERNIVSAKLRYAPLFTTFLIDYSRDPPETNGSALTHTVEGEVGLTHAFTERFRSLSTVGALIASAPPLDDDRRPIVSPVIGEELVYAKSYWLSALFANYTYGSANPRLGFGPSASAGVTMEGTPFPQGRVRNLDLIANALATRSAFRQGPDDVSRLSFVSAGIEARYRLTNAFGLLAGYNFRYATFEGTGAFPSLIRHVIFIGISGYFASDKTLPTLQTFASPVTPPG